MVGFDTLRREQNAKKLPPSSEYPALHNLVKPHLDSFNSMFEDHLIDLAIQHLEVRQVEDSAGNKMRCKSKLTAVWIEDVQVAKPMLNEREHRSLNRALYPTECRQRGITYKAKMTCKLAISVNDGPAYTESKIIGSMPIMVKSTKCHLAELSPAQLVKAKEDSEELGGYFIVNGIERIIRLLIVPRRNHV